MLDIDHSLTLTHIALKAHEVMTEALQLKSHLNLKTEQKLQVRRVTQQTIVNVNNAELVTERMLRS